MLTKVQKWGNSLGLRIPKSFAEEARVEEGTPVDLSVSNGQLVIRPIRPIRTARYELDHLLTGVTDDDLHDEVGTGKPLGRENW